MQMQALADKIEIYMQEDPGQRGLDQWACKDHLLPAAQSLTTAGHVLITTGFYILTAGVIETDGPPGAIIMAHALATMGKSVSIVVDSHSAKIMQSGLDAIGSQVELRTVEPNQSIDPEAILRPETTHLVALERPGKAADGCYYNFRGMDISAFVAPMDDLFGYARRSRKIVTIGIGDGGNELGLKLVSDNVDRHVKTVRPISCKTAADFCICAGVSNWGGYGIAALLSHLTKRNLMPAPDRLIALLDAIVAAGAVDGVTGSRAATVDGLRSAWEHRTFTEMHRIAEEMGVA